jgi:hypothetical protein
MSSRHAKDRAEARRRGRIAARERAAVGDQPAVRSHAPKLASASVQRSVDPLDESRSRMTFVRSLQSCARAPSLFR